MTQVMTAAMKTRADCRLCGGCAWEQVLSLGDTPLANAFVPASARGQAQPQFPLNVWLCGACGHVQLRDVVDPELLFRHYVYVSGTSPVFVEHFRQYAAAIQALTHMPPASQVLEIGSNDGTLLRFFQQAGHQVLGIDPAQEIAAAATQRGIPTRAEFFTAAQAKALRTEGWQPRAILANNVFAHADDLHDILDGVAALLDPAGVFAFEVSYLVDVYEHTLFDTIYHEHLSYHTVKPLVPFFERHGLELIDAQRVSPHGGSLRGIAQRRGGPHARHPRVAQLIALEQQLGLDRAAAYHRLQADVQARKAELTALLAQLKAAGQRVAGFGAPAKATTLIFHFGLRPDSLEYIVDDSPWKQGLYSPGHHIPIVPASYLYDPAHRVDAVVILAWNFAEAIIKTHARFLEQGGRFIIPLPRLEVRAAR